MQGGMSGNMMVVGTISHKAPWACASEAKQKLEPFESRAPNILKAWQPLF